MPHAVGHTHALIGTAGQIDARLQAQQRHDLAHPLDVPDVILGVRAAPAKHTADDRLRIDSQQVAQLIAGKAYHGRVIPLDQLLLTGSSDKAADQHGAIRRTVIELGRAPGTAKYVAPFTVWNDESKPIQWMRDLGTTKPERNRGRRKIPDLVKHCRRRARDPLQQPRRYIGRRRQDHGVGFVGITCHCFYAEVSTGMLEAVHTHTGQNRHIRQRRF